MLFVFSPESEDVSGLSEDVIALQYKAKALYELKRNEAALQCLERLAVLRKLVLFHIN